MWSTSGGWRGCLPKPPRASPLPAAHFWQLASGIFPGSVPIYRGNTLIGGIGVSGDGIDQDDMVSFLGLHNAGVRLNTGVANAPKAIRADQIEVQTGGTTTRLRYVNCPFAPFLDDPAQNVCEGL